MPPYMREQPIIEMSEDHKHLWDRCREYIKQRISPEQYDNWFKEVSSISFQDNTLRLAVPSAFFADQLEERFLPVIQEAIMEVFNQKIMIFYYFRTAADDPSSAQIVRSQSPSPTILAQSTAKKADPFAGPTPTPFNSQLNPIYNFENYVVGESNRLAYRVAESVAANPAEQAFNPLFIFGPTGVGKTHLIQAVGVRIKETRPDSRVLYISARMFENQFTAASLNGDQNNFFYFYQSIDTLIIDDVQDLMGKKKTQNMFFHIFNHLTQNNRQIILSSDTPPSALEGFEERLLSRFSSGMTAELLKPELDLRRRVLTQKAEQEGLDLPKEVIDYISENITSSIRDLVGVMVSLSGRASILGCDITLDLARQIVGNAIKVTKKKVTMDAILKCVGNYYNIEPSDITGSCRRREVSDARQVAMYLAKKHAKLAVTSIASKIGRTYPTVIYGCKLIQQRLSMEKKLMSDITSIEAALG